MEVGIFDDCAWQGGLKYYVPAPFNLLTPMNLTANTPLKDELVSSDQLDELRDLATQCALQYMRVLLSDEDFVIFENYLGGEIDRTKNLHFSLPALGGLTINCVDMKAHSSIVLSGRPVVKKETGARGPERIIGEYTRTVQSSVNWHLHEQFQGYGLRGLVRNILDSKYGLYTEDLRKDQFVKDFLKGRGFEEVAFGAGSKLCLNYALAKQYFEHTLEQTQNSNHHFGSLQFV